MSRNGARREARNADSARLATRFGATWTQTEEDELTSRWPHANVDEHVAIAAELGRTVEACAQRALMIKWGETRHIAEPRDGRAQGRRVVERPTGICPSCHYALSISGTCGCI